MGKPFSVIRSRQASAPGVDRQATAHAAGADGAAPDELPGVLAPIWRSDWMRMRWVFLAAAAVFIASLGWSLFQARPKPIVLLLGLGEIAVFGDLVVEGVLRSRRRLLPVEGPGAIAVVAAMTVAAAAIAIIERGSLGPIPFFLAGMIAGRLRPDELAVRVISVIAVASVLAYLPYSHDPWGTLTNGLSVAVLSLTVFGIRMLQRTNRELLAAREELARSAVAEERLRISRDLHDVLGHDLSLIALKSELARRLLPDDPSRAAGEIADVERTAREALRAVRETVSGYRQPTLAAELAGAREALSAAGIECSVEGGADPLPLPSGVEAVLAWAVREGTTNVIRHSGARHCRVRISLDRGDASVELIDDGDPGPAVRPAASRGGEGGRPGGRSSGGSAAPRVGTAAGVDGEASAPGGKMRGAGSGLDGLAERVAASGGRLEAGPQAAGGFRLKVVVPLTDGQAA